MSESNHWRQRAYQGAMTLLRGREGVCQTLSTDQQRRVWELSETELLRDDWDTHFPPPHKESADE